MRSNSHTNEPKLRLNIRSPADKAGGGNLSKAAEKKRINIETIDEAWARILSMKNSAPDQRRLAEVKQAMEAGEIGREAESAGKRFSKAEALRLWRVLDEKRAEDRLRDMVENTPDNYWLITDEDALDAFLRLLDEEDEIVFDVETTGTDVWSDYIVGHVITAVKADVHAYIPTKHDDPRPQLDNALVNEKLRPYYEDDSLGKIAHNASFDIHMLDREGITLRGLTWDTLEAMKLLNENEPTFALKPLVTRYLRDDSHTYGELFGKKGFDKIPLDQALAYAAKDGDVTLKLRDFQRYHLAKMPEMLEYFETVEVPLIPIVVEMEKEGYEIDLEFAREYGDQLRRGAAESYDIVVESLGDINLNSPAQLKEAIENHVGKEIENTNANQTLKPLSKEWPVINELLKYREKNKLLTTYIDALPKLINDKTGRLHTNFNQNGARTGRFSSGGGGVNLQNQPDIARKMFVAPKGCVLLGGDWSQQEYRCLAYFSQEPELINNYIEGKDLYSEVASDVFGLPVEECGDGTVYRGHAKVLLLAVAYGGGAGMLSTSIGVTKQRAQEFLDEFFNKYPKVSEWIEENQRFVKRHGFVWLDKKQRKRRLPGARNKNDKSYYSSVFTQSTNGRVQGSAAIQTKRTMIELDKLCKRKTENGQGRWSIWTVVHDEAILCVPETIERKDVEDFEDVMVNTYKFGNVPNKCDLEIFTRWGEAVSVDKWFETRR